MKEQTRSGNTRSNHWHVHKIVVEHYKIYHVYHASSPALLAAPHAASLAPVQGSALWPCHEGMGSLPLGPGKSHVQHSFFKLIFNWSIIALQCCIGFCHTPV